MLQVGSDFFFFFAFDIFPFQHFPLLESRDTQGACLILRALEAAAGWAPHSHCWDGRFGPSAPLLRSLLARLPPGNSELPRGPLTGGAGSRVVLFLWVSTVSHPVVCLAPPLDLAAMRDVWLAALPAPVRSVTLACRTPVSRCPAWVPRPDALFLWPAPPAPPAEELHSALHEASGTISSKPLL